ncbi:hypothetical protein GLAREA_04177 [Glarea lozoyensis ATCC 20868]|uniref:Uncharacterized protein n=1 Tax=Glarea lozoyensis (strain ATCC 20868 / MF5171) TaxID=1116229 RepID=S3D037_GLAL2|nr:uncharacterized protein GLAREA_04177 [Glarea lozoyensis ATCC 20868]EPE31210.1 hypothetical protein GLAREA_04177 [Glarea lozoyensis ATCC 20868]
MAPIPSINLDSLSSALSDVAKRITSPSNLPRHAEPLPNPTPTATVRSLWTRVIYARQSTSSIIPTAYGDMDTGPSPGTVAGIVLGSVAGFLLLLWLIYTCLNFNNTSNQSVYTEEVVRDRRKSHRGSQRSRRVSETVEVRRERTPVRIVREPSPRRPDPIIVEEERREIHRSRSRRGSDEVVVIEEHSPPRRKKHRDRDSRREEEISGFRTVDPSAFGGVVGGNSRRGSGRR